MSKSEKLGKYGILLPPVNYHKHHWALQYLNKFEQLSERKISIIIPSSIIQNREIIPPSCQVPIFIITNPTVVYSNLHSICLSKGFICKFDRFNKQMESINDYKIRHITSGTDKAVSCQFKMIHQINNKIMNYYINDGYEFFIFEFNSRYTGHFCIIPASMMIARGYIVTENMKSKTVITIKYPNYVKPHWTSEFIDRFDLLLR
jgi:hypothetical protein